MKTTNAVPKRRRLVAWATGLAIAIGLAVGAGAPAALAASDDEGGSGGFVVSGTVKYEGEGVEGVEMLVTGDANGFSGSATTAENGSYRVDVPEKADYTVTINVETLPEGVPVPEGDAASKPAAFGFTTLATASFTLGEASAATTVSFWDILLQRVISGLNFGLLLALAAIGITLIFGTTGVNNFAHGEMLTFGAITQFGLIAAGVPFWIALILTIVLSAALGAGQEVLIFKPLRRKGVGLVQVLIVTIGLSIALRYVWLIAFGGGTQNYSPAALDAWTQQVVQLGPARLTVMSLLTMAISLVVLALVALFLTRTRIGKATRAVSDNASLASASGINVDRIILIVWVMAGALTGLSGVLYGLFRGLSWDMGFAILLLLFAAVTVGGLGSPFGAAVGALFIGLATEISTAFGVPPELRYAVALVILIIVLIVRPQGFLGRRERIG